ncbi:MAG: hypothetical protein EOM50_19060, partial [Erysipelotrichia bacterium]|nr:hypothetical protein [Erysipelotrichia bacterium]
MALGKLDIIIAADTAQIRKDMNTAVGIMQSSSKEFGDYAKKATDSVSSSFNLLKSVIATVGISELTREFIKTSDSMQLLEARIKLVSKATEDFKRTQSSLLKIAYENRTAYQRVGELYAGLSPAMSTLNASTEAVLGVTDAFSKSLLISGASVEEAAGSTRQFSQAMASGVLRGEEFNSMMENNPRAMKVLMETLGKTQGELRKMAENGELASGVVAGALLKSLSQLKEEASKMPNTISGEFARLKDQISIAIDEINKATGASESVVNVIKSIEEVLRNASSIDFTQFKQYAEYVLQIGEAYIVYKGAVEATAIAKSTFNSVQAYSAKITAANTAATVAAIEAERLGTIVKQANSQVEIASKIAIDEATKAEILGTVAVKARVTAEEAKNISLHSSIWASKANVAILQSEAIAHEQVAIAAKVRAVESASIVSALKQEAMLSEKAALSATKQSYELQGIASKAGIASIAMSGLSSAFKTFAPTAVLFGITEIFLNWDKITGSIKTNLVSASDQLEKMTNNQLTAQLDEYKKKIQETNEEIQKLSPQSKGFSYFGTLSEEDKTKAKAQIDTLKQQKEQYEKTVNEIIEFKKNTNKEIAKSNIDYSNDYLTRNIKAVSDAEADRLIKDGQAQVALAKHIKESTATIESQISSLEKQYSINKEIENLNIESSLRNEAISKPEAERLKEKNSILSQIAKNQAEINLLKSKEYDKKNNASAGTEEAKDLQKINDLQKENEINQRKIIANEERYKATVKSVNEELMISIGAINMSDVDKKYQDLSKSVQDLINKGADLKL